MISSQPVDFNSLSDSNKHSVIIGSCGLIDRFVYRICLFNSLEIRAPWWCNGQRARLVCGRSTKHAALRRKSKDWLARNQCLSEATCLSG